MAASLMKVGESRVWINPEEIEKVESAITKEEVRRLIHEGVIGARAERGISRGRYKARFRKKSGKGSGSKKGSPRRGKSGWVAKIRSLRSRLRELKTKRVITRDVYRRLIPMAKGGAFRSISHLHEYLESHNLARRR